MQRKPYWLSPIEDNVRQFLPALSLPIQQYEKYIGKRYFVTPFFNVNSHMSVQLLHLLLYSISVKRQQHYIYRLFF